MWQIELIDQVTWWTREDPDEAAPDETLSRAGERESVQHEAGGRRDQQRQQHELREQPPDPAHPRVLVDVRRKLAPVRLALRLHQPARVGVPEAAEAVAVADVGTVRVAIAVGVGVMLAVIRDPVQHGSLDRQRGGHRERVLHPGVGLEGPVGEQAMEADRHAAGGQQVHHGEDREVDGVDGTVPQEHDRDEGPEERDDHAEQVGVSFGSRHRQSFASPVHNFL